MTWLRTGWRAVCGAFCIALGATAVQAQDRDLRRYEIYAKPQRLVRLPDGRRLNLLCMGSGGPTVLLESGWADGNVVWRLVQPVLARNSRVCSYDRSGIGFSDRAAGPRDADHIADDLAALVRAAGLRPPYVLVGHSLGGLTMRLFADRHRDELAGMVLVDPTVENQDRRFAEVLPDRSWVQEQNRNDRQAVPAGQLAPALPASVETAIARYRASSDFQLTALAELSAIRSLDSAQITASAKSYGAMPLIVLTGSENIGNPAYTPAQAAMFKQVWKAMHEEVAALSTRGEGRQAPGAGHLVIYEDVASIAKAVSDVIDMAGKPPG